jgi:thioredoxin reductase (NADPH)
MAHKVVIVGSGPAGLTAAIYAARANLEPVVVEGLEWGGQLQLTTEVENYPGFPKGLLGPEMMNLFHEQAERFGTKFVKYANVDKVDFSKRPFKLWVADELLEAQSVIIATGASAMWLNIPSEQKLRNKGVSACATCDGALPIFRNQQIAVVGGGDTAMEETSFLTKFASQVTVIHRRDKFRASKIMQKRVLENPKVKVKWNSVVDEVLGGDAVEGVRLKDVVTGKKEDLPLKGLFLALPEGPDRHGRARLHQNPRQHALQRRGRVHCGRLLRPAVPPSGHGRGVRLHGRNRRRAVARDPARRALRGGRGASGARARGDARLRRELFVVPAVCRHGGAP